MEYQICVEKQAKKPVVEKKYMDAEREIVDFDDLVDIYPAAAKVKFL